VTRDQVTEPGLFDWSALEYTDAIDGNRPRDHNAGEADSCYSEALEGKDSTVHQQKRDFGDTYRGTVNAFEDKKALQLISVRPSAAQ
jgi:hypothetical protein